jgi:hypothetical protein
VVSKATAVQERERETVAEAVTEAPTCQHHWLIDTPRGTMSQGRCKSCGEQREFRNSANDYVWEDESSSGYNAWRGVRSQPAKVADDEMAASPGSAREPALVV